MTAFCSLYLPGVAPIADSIRTALAALGYEFYDPFGLIPGKAFPHVARLFVAPPRGGWMRVLVVPETASLDALLPSLSRLAPCLLVSLDGDDAHIEACAGEKPAAPEIAFSAYARDAGCLRSALEDALVPTDSRAVGGVPLDALPDDVRALAGSLDPRQTESLFARISGTVARKSGADPAARDLLRQPDWNSVGGRRIAAVMDCLGVPNWRDPDFVTLRDAYALHHRRRQRPNATLYPGDTEALAAVPDALDYTPIYAGKS